MSSDVLESHKHAQSQIASQYRPPSSSGPLFTATVVVVILHLADRNLPPGALDELRRMLFHSGFVPYGILWWGVFGISYLAQIYTRRLFPLMLARELEKDVVEVASRFGLDSQQLMMTLLQHEVAGQKAYFSHRFMRLFRMYQSNPDTAAVQRLRDEILENDDHMHHLGFSAVRCSEWAMPLFGFLGTVIGIGQAIGSLKAGMQWDADGQFSVNQSLVKESFAGMALAFETTLLGLVGLLIVGTMHAFVRKRLDEALAKAEPYFTSAIENTGTMPAPVHIKDAGTLESEIRTLRADFQQRDEHVRTIQTMVETVIDQDPQFQSIKKIIFKPVFTFESVFEGASTGISEYVQANAKNTTWRFGASSAATDGSGNAVLVVVQAATAICCFDDKTLLPTGWLALPRKCDRIVACSDTKLVVRAADNGELLAVDVAAKKAISINKSLKEGEWLYASTGQRTTQSIVLFTGDPLNRRIEVVSIADPSASQSVPVPSAGDTSWSMAALAPDGSCILIAGTSSGGKKSRTNLLLKIPIVSPEASSKGSSRGDDEAGTPTVDVAAATLIQVQKVPNVRQLCWIGKDDVLLLDGDGKAWRFDLTRDSPSQLTHEKWTASQNTALSVGHNRWVARHAVDTLTMWKVWPTGALHDYPDVSLEVDSWPPLNVAVSQGGRLLWCSMPQRIAFWRFPEYQSDTRQ